MIEGLANGIKDTSRDKVLIVFIYIVNRVFARSLAL